MKKNEAIKVLNWYRKVNTNLPVTPEETLEVYKLLPEYIVYDNVNNDQAMFHIYIYKEQLMTIANG